MDILIICLTALLASLLTFFSGFGLGTLLTPVFAIFFPVELAVALTAVVHFLNNIFKLFLVGRHADKDIALRFGIPALLASIAGAFLLNYMSKIPAVHSYELNGRIFEITVLKLVMAALLIFFSLMEIVPRLKNFRAKRDKMVLGGILSGFFGGLAGFQGALRSAFLIKADLSKEAYIATGTVIACMIDVSRLGVYSKRFAESGLENNIGLLIAATLSAFAGAYFGRKVLHKVTMSSIQMLVAIMLFILALALGSGLI